MGDYSLLFDLKILSYDYFQGSHWVYENLSAPFWRLYRHTYEGAWMRLGKDVIETRPDLFTVISPYTPVKACGGSKSYHFHVHFVAGYPFNVMTSRLLTFAPGRESIKCVEQLIQRISEKRSSQTADSLLCVQLCAQALARPQWEQWGPVAAD